MTDEHGDVRCNDCGALYRGLGLDLVLPDQQWKAICPEGGILCANCICKRADEHGGTCVLAWVDRIDYSISESKDEPMTERDLNSARLAFDELGPEHEIAMLIGHSLVREVEQLQRLLEVRNREVLEAVNEIADEIRAMVPKDEPVT